MKHLNKLLLHALYILVLGIALLLPALAANDEAQPEGQSPEAALTEEAGEALSPALSVLPEDDADAEIPSVREGDTAVEVAESAIRARHLEADSGIRFTTSQTGIDLIKEYEGYYAYRYWDYSQYTIGYGTSYTEAVKYYPAIASRGYITREEAEAALALALVPRENALNNWLIRNGVVVNQNQFDALIDFTYNVGTGWMSYVNSTTGEPCKLKQMLLDKPETWTEERTREAFGTWVTAGGVRLQQLVERRKSDSDLFLTRTTTYRDVPDGRWYSKAVQSAYDLGVMTGYGDDTFGPENLLTRAEMVSAMARFAGADTSKFLGTAGPFTDVDATMWYAKSVAWAYSEGLVAGRDDGSFDPAANITRQHLCAIVTRYLKVLGIEAPETDYVFKDDELMEPSSKASVYYCYALGIVRGVGEDCFDPMGSATRAQVATILVNMYNLIQKRV